MADNGICEKLAALAKAQNRRVAVAESLTGGLITSSLAEASEASDWLRGGIVAYSSDVKFRLLDVPEGPVVSEAAAAAMARSVARLLDADTALAVTGVGGPDSQDGVAPGTVWAATFVDGETATFLLTVDGEDPADICERTCQDSLRLLAERLT